MTQLDFLVPPRFRESATSARSVDECSRERGIQRSADHAEAVEAGWNDRAVELIAAYPEQEFMTEDLREYAETMNFPEPPDTRAWGAVVRRAAREGRIMKVGLRNTKGESGHQRPGTLWRKI